MLSSEYVINVCQKESNRLIKSLQWESQVFRDPFRKERKNNNVFSITDAIYEDQTKLVSEVDLWSASLLRNTLENFWFSPNSC